MGEAKKLITVVPVLYDTTWTKLCLSKLKGDVLIIDNGSDRHMKDIIRKYNKIVNEKNIYVNPAWNQALKWFMESDYDLMALIGSDVVMMADWEKFVLEFFTHDIMMPTEIYGMPETMKNVLVMDNEHHEIECAPGIFFVFDKKMAEIVYPIPEEIKIWFGDNWIINKLREQGYKLNKYVNLYCIHGNSRSVSGLNEIGVEIIHQDKLAWQRITQ